MINPTGFAKGDSKRYKRSSFVGGQREAGGRQPSTMGASAFRMGSLVPGLSGVYGTSTTNFNRFEQPMNTGPELNMVKTRSRSEN